MKYKAVLLDQDRVFTEGDDLALDFVIMDENGAIVNSLTGWTFKGQLYSSWGSIDFTNSNFAVSGNKVTLTIGTSSTAGCEESIEYILEIEGTLSSKIYTLCREIFWANEGFID